MTNRSKFLRLMWSQKKTEFAVIKARDGLDYVVPVPVRGPIKAPRCKLERRVTPCPI